MIVDTSALMAILKKEPEREHFIVLLAKADQVLLSAGSWIELAAVLRGDKDQATRGTLADLLVRFDIQIAPVSVAQAHIGHQTYLTYGRGNHPARLNLGDCFSYALAKERGMPLLFKGEDFSLTDVVAAA